MDVLYAHMYKSQEPQKSQNKSTNIQNETNKTNNGTNRGEKSRGRQADRSWCCNIGAAKRLNKNTCICMLVLHR